MDCLQVALTIRTVTESINSIQRFREMNCSKANILPILGFVILIGFTFSDHSIGDVVSFDETFSGTGGTFDELGWLVTGQGHFETNGSGDQVYVLQSANGTDYDNIHRTVGAGSFRSEYKLVNPLGFLGFSSFGLLVQDVDGGPGGEDVVRLFLAEAPSQPGSLRAIFSSLTIGNTSITAGELILGNSVTELAFRLDYEMNLLGTGIFSASVDVNNSGNFQSLGSIDQNIYGVQASLDRALIMELSPFGSIPRIELDRASLTSVPEPLGLPVFALGIGLVMKRRLRSCSPGLVSRN
jgi:hypothetical protein